MTLKPFPRPSAKVVSVYSLTAGWLLCKGSPFNSFCMSIQVQNGALCRQRFRRPHLRGLIALTVPSSRLCRRREFLRNTLQQGSQNPNLKSTPVKLEFLFTTVRGPHTVPTELLLYGAYISPKKDNLTLFSVGKTGYCLRERACGDPGFGIDRDV